MVCEPRFTKNLSVEAEKRPCTACKDMAKHPPAGPVVLIVDHYRAFSKLRKHKRLELLKNGLSAIVCTAWPAATIENLMTRGPHHHYRIPKMHHRPQ